MVSLDAHNKIRAKRLWERRWGSPFRRNLFLFGRYPVIISLDTALSFAVAAPISLKRKKGLSPVTREEFEVSIARALEQVLPDAKKQARTYFGSGELDTVLLDARTSHFILDGKEKLATPVGSSAMHAAGTLLLLFSTREVFHGLSEIFRRNREAFITEHGAATAMILKKLHPSGTNVLFPEPPRAASFSVFGEEKNGGFRKKELRWDSFTVVRVVRSAFGVSDEAAKDILRSYREGDCSEYAHGFLKKLLSQSASSLIKAAKENGITGTVYLRPDVCVPIEVPFKAGGMAFVPLMEEELLRSLGFGVRRTQKGGVPELSVLAPFLEFYYNESDPETRKFLRRRIHWIAP